MASPLERSKAELESQGYAVWKVERPASMFYPTLDLFNLMDLVAIRSDRPGVLGVQVCGEDIAPHIHKIIDGYSKQKIKNGEIVTELVPANPYLKVWLEAGNPFFIWGWRLRKNEGKKASFQLREIEFILENGEVHHRETEAKP